MPVLEVKAGQIRYEVHGSGYPVLLFAPGFLSSRIERWSTNPARPGVAQDWLDPIVGLAAEVQLIALDVRNAGQSRASLGGDAAWPTCSANPFSLRAHLARAPNVEVFAPWKGPRYRKAAMNRVREFLAAHRPEATMASRAAAR